MRAFKQSMERVLSSKVSTCVQARRRSPEGQKTKDVEFALSSEGVPVRYTSSSSSFLSTSEEAEEVAMAGKV